jgi:hypothetical protein
VAFVEIKMNANTDPPAGDAAIVEGAGERTRNPCRRAIALPHSGQRPLEWTDRAEGNRLEATTEEIKVNKKDTPRRNRLPIISRETRRLIGEEVREEELGGYICQFLKRLQKKNPEAAYFIEEYARGSRCANQTMTCMALLYRMLEAQAEVDAISIKWLARG